MESNPSKNLSKMGKLKLLLKEKDEEIKRLKTVVETQATEIEKLKNDGEEEDKLIYDNIVNLNNIIENLLKENTTLKSFQNLLTEDQKQLIRFQNEANDRLLEEQKILDNEKETYQQKLNDIEKRSLEIKNDVETNNKNINSIILDTAKDYLRSQQINPDVLSVKEPVIEVIDVDAEDMTLEIEEGPSRNARGRNLEKQRTSLEKVYFKAFDKWVLTNPNEASQGINNKFFAECFWQAHINTLSKMFENKTSFVRTMLRSPNAIEKRYNRHLSSKSLI